MVMPLGLRRTLFGLGLCATFNFSVALGADDPWLKRRFVTFGDEGLGWLAVSLPSLEVRPIRVPGFEPEGMALAPDGVTVVFTAPSQAAENSLLFRWRLGHAEEAPVSIGESVGFHADPFVTENGSWVYFAHNPHARGPPGRHGTGAFAELYRVHLDGSHLEALTSSSGCHVNPFANSAGQLFYVHLSCMVGHRLEQLVGDARAEQQILPRSTGTEPAVSPDDQDFLVSRRTPIATTLERWQLAADKPSEVVPLASPARHARPRFGRRPAEILYQTRAGVFIREEGQARLLSSFEGRVP